MTGLDIFALIVLLVLFLTVIGVLVFLGKWPGDIAKSRGHPQTDAIRVAGWLGILSLGIIWPIAMIWAFTRQGGAAPAEVAEKPAEEAAQ